MSEYDTTTEHEHDDLTDDPAAHGSGENGAGGEEEIEGAPRNLLDRLRVRRSDMADEAVSGDRILTVPIPGFDDELFARFAYSPDAFDKLKSIGKKAIKSRHPRKELHVAMDTLLFACVGIFVSEDEGEHLEPIDPEGEPTIFDDKLATLMGFEAQNARQVIAKVFNNDLAIVAMASRVSTWMQGEDAGLDEDFLQS